MKVKQTIESSGKYKEPNPKDLLMPEVLVCPECGMLIYPLGDDEGRSYYFPDMKNEHRYYTKHYARASFTCAACGCEFSRTANTYTEFNWYKMTLDISKLLKVLIVLSIIGVFLCSLCLLALLPLGDS